MEQAIDFTLPDQDGNPFTLSSLKGQKVVLYFYPRDNTSGCTKEACSLRDSFSGLRDLNATVVGISPDSVESHRKFADKYSLPFTLLSDKDKSVMQAYGAYGEKKLYGKVSMGVIRTTFLLDEEGKVAKVWKKVNTATHGEDVRKELEKLSS